MVIWWVRHEAQSKPLQNVRGRKLPARDRAEREVQSEPLQSIRGRKLPARDTTEREAQSKPLQNLRGRKLPASDSRETAGGERAESRDSSTRSCCVAGPSSAPILQEFQKS